jgi:hypothetical protein
MHDAKKGITMASEAVQSAMAMTSESALLKEILAKLTEASNDIGRFLRGGK